jgi:IS605 OrfB family transposase
LDITKSYTCRIDGNIGKTQYLNQQLCVIEKLSEYAFSLGKNNWKQLMPLYNACRREFPTLNSKVVQNFLRFHFVSPNKFKKPKKPPRASIIVDYQSFGMIFDETTKLTNFWLRFHRKNFSLLGKFLLTRIENPNDLKLVQIFNRKSKLYCKLSIRTSKEIKPLEQCSKSIGLDVNSRRIVLNNNDFYNLKRLYHRKKEHKKNNQKKRSLKNYTKDVIQKMTTIIANKLQKDGLEVLVFEKLRHIRRSSSKKLGTSKGKEINHTVNSLAFRMFQSFLEYKCLDRGINVVYVNPAYTSQQCSSCGSINTKRQQTSFRCLDCCLELDADLNGSRNICGRYTGSDGLQVNTAPY